MTARSDRDNRVAKRLGVEQKRAGGDGGGRAGGNRQRRNPKADRGGRTWLITFAAIGGRTDAIA